MLRTGRFLQPKRRRGFQSACEVHDVPASIVSGLDDSLARAVLQILEIQIAEDEKSLVTEKKARLSICLRGHTPPASFSPGLKDDFAQSVLLKDDLAQSVLQKLEIQIAEDEESLATEEKARAAKVAEAGDSLTEEEKKELDQRVEELRYFVALAKERRTQLKLTMAEILLEQSSFEVRGWRSALDLGG